MNQQTFSQIINAGESVSVTNELMEAAFECARLERSDAFDRGARWIHGRAGAAVAQLSRVKSIHLVLAGVAVAIIAIR